MRIINLSFLFGILPSRLSESTHDHIDYSKNSNQEPDYEIAIPIQGGSKLAHIFNCNQCLKPSCHGNATTKLAKSINQRNHFLSIQFNIIWPRKSINCYVLNENRTFRAVPMPDVWILPHNRHFWQPTQSIIRLIFLKLDLKTFSNGYD